MIGRTVGKYRIVGQIGRGGAGVVYKAVDETLNRDVAIKTLNPDLANTEVMKRFRAEATTLAKLNHPQIATIFELYHDGSDLLMVMEFVRGETLDKLVERLGPMPPERAAYIADQILSALEHAHRAGVVHRDMKPANVMVTEAGLVKIMDFGIARVRGAEQMTMDGRLMGTPAYMPPEQVLGQETDGRTDLYSVGVVFYRLLTGVLPFTADSALGMLQRQILETPTPIHTHRPDLPAWCDEIVQRALAKAPADRFQTAEAFREELARAAGLQMTADLPKTFAIVANDGPTISSQPIETLDLSRDQAPRSRFAWAYVAAATCAILTAIFAFTAFRAPIVDVAATAPPSAPELPVEKPAPVPGVPVIISESTPEPQARPTAAVREREVVTAVDAPAREEEEEPAVEEPPGPARRRPTSSVNEPLLVFETKTLVGTRKPREHDAQLVLAEGKITVTSDIESEYPFYSIPYNSVVSITYSHSRDPMWNSPQGPAQVTRSGGGPLGRFGLGVARDWIALRTNTQDQFIAMRFDELLIRRILLALEERTGRRPELLAQPKDGR
jgi:serine/threonine-protein kinase